MEPIESTINAINTITRKCLGITPGERLLVVCDQGTEDLARDIFRASSHDWEPMLIHMRARDRHGAEPPAAVAAAMSACDVAILCTSKSLSHTEARRTATSKGVRIASMPGITRDMMARTLSVDFDQVAEESTNLAREMTAGARIVISGKNGTLLSASIEGRQGHADTGNLTYRGASGNLPAGEAYVAPLEGTAEGILVCDGSIAQLGRIEGDPVVIEIKNGQFVRASGNPRYAAALTDLLDSVGDQGRNVAEIGVGTNPSAIITGNVLEDEKVRGTVHVAFGDNSGFGGNVRVPLHIDCVAQNVSIAIEKGLPTTTRENAK